MPKITNRDKFNLSNGKNKFIRDVFNTGIIPQNLIISIMSISIMTIAINSLFMGYWDYVMMCLIALGLLIAAIKCDGEVWNELAKNSTDVQGTYTIHNITMKKVNKRITKIIITTKEPDREFCLYVNDKSNSVEIKENTRTKISYFRAGNINVITKMDLV